MEKEEIEVRTPYFHWGNLSARRHRLCFMCRRLSVHLTMMIVADDDVAHKINTLFEEKGVYMWRETSAIDGNVERDAYVSVAACDRHLSNLHHLEIMLVRHSKISASIVDAAKRMPCLCVLCGALRAQDWRLQQLETLLWWCQRYRRAVLKALEVSGPNYRLRDLLKKKWEQTRFGWR